MSEHDAQSPCGGPSVAEALEARVVACVLGEASPFERAEIERLVAARPELAIFRRRIEAVHGLLAQAAADRRGETPRLSPERRAAVLAAIGARTAPGVAEPTAMTPLVVRRGTGPEWRALRLYFGVAAACVAMFLVVYNVSELRRYGAAEHEVLKLEAPAVESQFFLPTAEEADSQGELRKSARELSTAELKAEIARHDEELLHAQMELRALDSQAEETPVQALAFRQRLAPVGSASGGFTFSGSVRHSELRQAADDSEPLTVPEGDEDQRVELPLYEVKETSDQGYTATETLAGSRLNTELRDVGSSVGVVDTSVAAARPASRFKADGAAAPQAPAAPDADSSWASGFADTATTDDRFAAARVAGVNVVTTGFLRDTGATDNDTLLSYTTRGDTGAMQGNFTGRLGTSVAGATGESTSLTSSVVHVGDAWSTGFGADAERPNEILFGQGTAGGIISGSKGADTAADKDGNLKLAFTPAKLTPPPSPGSAETDAKAKRRPAPPPSVDEVDAAREPVSTFSLHVSDASFRIAAAALARGELPEAGSIRPEEFYNAFDYADPSPARGQEVGCRIEQAAHPFLQQRTLVRVAMKVGASGRGAGRALRLTVLLDTSGSMEREDRVASVRRAMEVLSGLMGPDDRITLIGFARRPRLLAEAVPGDQARALVDILARTPADGGTNLEEALKLADELAQRHFDSAAQNRIVLLTDGAANLGNADPAQLATRIEALRGRGVAFDACGVGTDGLDDDVLEALTRRGDGRYYVIDSPEEADSGFARQLAGAFRPAAKNVKVQVRFNPARVGAYRLIGFEKHRLREQDFRNDAVDAAELAAEEAAVALYQVEVLPEGGGEIGDVYVRFRDTETNRMVERTWTIAHDPRVRAFDRASPGIQLAGTAALLAEAMRGGPSAEAVDFAVLAPVVHNLRSHYSSQPRVQELANLFEQLRAKLAR